MNKIELNFKTPQESLVLGYFSILLDCNYKDIDIYG